MTLRLRDVIGEWEPVKAGDEGGKCCGKTAVVAIGQRPCMVGHERRSHHHQGDDDAGADIDPIRAAAGHNQASTTVRYIRGTTGKSRKIAAMRVGPPFGP
jgi:hypothetical protein